MATATITNVVIQGDSVIITLSQAVTTKEKVVLNYTQTAQNAIADVALNKAADISDLELTNDTPDVDAPQLVSSVINGNTIILKYDEPLSTALIPNAANFTIDVSVIVPTPPQS